MCVCVFQCVCVSYKYVCIVIKIYAVPNYITVYTTPNYDHLFIVIHFLLFSQFLLVLVSRTQKSISNDVAFLYCKTRIMAIFSPGTFVPYVIQDMRESNLLIDFSPYFNGFIKKNTNGRRSFRYTKFHFFYFYTY